MAYPAQTFNDIAALRAYLNSYIVTNGIGAIEAVGHNSIENGLIDFILKSPLNSGLVDIVNTTGSKQVQNAITYFMTSVPSSVVFGDNFWNEWVFINATTSDIPFASGLGYFDLDSLFKTEIPARSQIRISKATNGLWVQTGSISSSGTLQAVWDKFSVVIGDSSQAQGLSAVTPNAGTDTLILPYQVQPLSEVIFYQGIYVKPFPSYDFNVDVTYNASSTQYKFSQKLQEGYALDFGTFVKKVPAGNVPPGGLRLISVIVPSSGNTLVVNGMGTFVFAFQNGVLYASPSVVQVDSVTLDFSNVGGVIAGQTIYILDLP